MGHYNCLPVGGLDSAGNHIAHFKPYLGIGMVFPSIFNYIIVKSPGFGGMRGKGKKTVTTVDIVHNGYWPQTMGRVHIGILKNRMLRSPFGFRDALVPKLDALAVGIFTVIE